MPLNAKLHIETVNREGRTVLKSSFASHPFKLANVTEDKKEKFLQLMIMSSSPGILDGDDYECEVNVGEDCSLQLETQSYQRLFNMKNGARQEMNIRLHRGASLIYLPHPLVPHKNASFVSKNQIHLTSGCELIWGEVMSCGRKENGEVFEFSSYHNLTQVYLNEKLVVRENILLNPGKIDLLSTGQLEGHTHQASLIYLNENTEVELLIPGLMEQLNQQEHIAFGMSALPVNGIIVRIMGHKSEQLFNILHDVSNYIQCQSKMKNKIIHVA